MGVGAGGRGGPDRDPRRGRAGKAPGAQVLEDAAVSSFGAEDPAVGAGQYLRVDTLARHLTTTAMPNHSFHTVKQMRHSLYIPADTDDTWYWDRTEKVDAEVVATYGQAPPTADPYPLRGAEEPPTPIWKAPGGAWNGQAPYVTKEYLASLPDDPHQLLARVHEEKAGQNANEDEQVMVFIADMLRSGLVTAAKKSSSTPPPAPGSVSDPSSPGTWTPSRPAPWSDPPPYPPLLSTRSPHRSGPRPPRTSSDDPVVADGFPWERLRP